MNTINNLFNYRTNITNPNLNSPKHISKLSFGSSVDSALMKQIGLDSFIKQKVDENLADSDAKIEANVGRKINAEFAPNFLKQLEESKKDVNPEDIKVIIEHVKKALDPLNTADSTR